MTKFNGKEIRQGSVSDDGENCVMLICSKEDIRGQLSDNNDLDQTYPKGQEAEELVDRVFARIEHKGSDYVMEQFWTVIDALIEDESRISL